MSCMFCGAKNFNQPIGKWDVSNVEDMSDMFSGAENFNQDLSKWKVSDKADTENMFQDTPLENKEKVWYKRKH